MCSADAEAHELLTRRLGAQRVADDPGAADELIELCARLPLALSIAAARTASQPGLSLAALTADLRDARGRLDALDAGHAATNVRAVFSWSYQQLDAGRRRGCSGCSGCMPARMSARPPRPAWPACPWTRRAAGWAS